MDAQREAEQERNDRQLHELTSELRVILPGTTVIFAFLLTLPFSSGWGDVRDLERTVFFVALLSTALAIVLLVGESAYHRMRGEPYDKANLVRRATHQAIVALALLALALGSVVFVVGSVVYSRPVGGVAAAVVLAAAIGTWFAFPLYRRVTASTPSEQAGRGRRDHAPGPA